MVLALLDAQGSEAKKWRWVGKGADASLLAAAAFLRPNQIRTMVLTPSKTEVFSGVESMRDAYMLPGALRFGGLLGLLAAQATHSTEKE